MSNLDQRLDAIVQKRKKIRADVDRLKGRKEQAEANLRAVEEECRGKKIDPEKIDETIKQLESKYEKLVEDLEKDITEAEGALAPFVSGGTEQ
jgi:predicted  nucleic acid-binding Zn-ribbon protein